jgi:DeoR/GlpR family transcriptional regulator of sugar metabolism
MGVVSGFSFEDISKVYTDNGISEAHAKFLEEKKIELVTV